MAIDVETKDCTALSDSELAEMADMVAEGPLPWEIGDLSKEKEEWVLITHARDGNVLKGFSFCTLERIGGTPCIVIGMAGIKRTSKRDTVLRAMMTDQFRRSLMAFPDEDVLVGARFTDPAGFEAFRNLEDVIPRPDHKPTGEERAWGRRLAKRYGVKNGKYDDRTFTIATSNSLAIGLDHESSQPETTDAEIAKFFAKVNPKEGNSLVACGWAMAEFLAKLG